MLLFIRISTGVVPPRRLHFPSYSWKAARPLSYSARQRSFALYDVDDHDEQVQDNLRLTPKMPSPGLMFVTSGVIDSSKTSDEKYNRL